MILLFCYIGIIATVGYIVYFGDTDFHRDGCVGWLNDFIQNRALDLLHSTLLRIFGEKITSFLDGIVHWICWKPNPLLQIFYLGLTFGGLGVVVWNYYSRLPNPYVPAWQMTFGPCVVCVAVLSYFVTSYSDPGVIKKDNVNRFLSAYAYDNLMYDHKECSTCDIVRPARSKHCRICDRCVARFDHHCGWTNTCIGEGNYRYFLVFLYVNSLMMIYAAYITAAIGYGIVLEERLQYVYFLDQAGTKIPANTKIIFQYMMMHHGLLGSVCILCLVMGVVLFFFLLYHLNLVRKGLSTNESFKWGDLVAWRANCIRKASHALKVKEMEELRDVAAAAATTTTAAGPGGAVAAAPEEFKDTEEKKKARTKEASDHFFKLHGEFTNKYNEGFWTNLSYVFWRPSLYLSDPDYTPPKEPKENGDESGAKQQPAKSKKGKGKQK